MDNPHSRLDALSSRDARLVRRILSGRADANIRFAELRRLLRNMGFNERINGSHHIFGGPGIKRPINIQPLGALAKSGQIRQIRAIIKKEALPT